MRYSLRLHWFRSREQILVQVYLQNTTQSCRGPHLSNFSAQALQETLIPRKQCNLANAETKNLFQEPLTLSSLIPNTKLPHQRNQTTLLRVIEHSLSKSPPNLYTYTFFSCHYDDHATIIELRSTSSPTHLENITQRQLLGVKMSFFL